MQAHVRIRDTENRGRSADGTEVEPAIVLARVRDLLRAVALGQRNHTPAILLEEIDIGVHPSRRGRAERPGRHAIRRLGRPWERVPRVQGSGFRVSRRVRATVEWGKMGITGVIDEMVFDVVRQALALIEPLLQFRMRDVTRHHLSSAAELQSSTLQTQTH